MNYLKRPKSARRTIPDGQCSVLPTLVQVADALWKSMKPTAYLQGETILRDGQDLKNLVLIMCAEGRASPTAEFSPVVFSPVCGTVFCVLSAAFEGVRGSASGVLG